MTDDDRDPDHEPGGDVPPVEPPTDAGDLVDDVEQIVGDGGEDPDAVDPEDARPAGHYPRFRSNTWHYVPDELAGTISLGPGGDGEAGQDWVLSYTPERRDPEDREKVFVWLTPRALHELYIETKDLSPDARQAGPSGSKGTSPTAPARAAARRSVKGEGHPIRFNILPPRV